jgi:hypothetical protein
MPLKACREEIGFIKNIITKIGDWKFQIYYKYLKDFRYISGIRMYVG